MGVRLPARYPGAEWHPIPNFNGWAAPYDTLYAEALVGHSSEGHGAPPARFYDKVSAGAHFWNFQDGRLWQLSPLDQPSWANGQRNRVEPPTMPLVKDWYARGVNPNWFTVTMEHEGLAGEPLTEAQIDNDVKLGRWLEDNGMNLTTETFFGHGEISATACPSGRIPFVRILQEIHVPAPTPTPVPDPVAELNAASMKRFDIIRIASGPFPEMERAHKLLKDGGLL